MPATPQQGFQMSRTIHKYPFPYTASGEITLILPAGFRFLTIQRQHGIPTLWFEVNPSSDIPKVRVRVMLFVTGGDCSGHYLTYLGTVQSESGTFVGHYYMSEPESLDQPIIPKLEARTWIDDTTEQGLI
jgi:hypothetical protein